MSHLFTGFIDRILAKPIRYLFETPTRLLKTYVKHGMTVLDVGCGAGYYSLGMARSVGPEGRVVSVDTQAEAIATLRKKAEQASGYKVESAYVGVTGRHVTSLNNRAVVAITRNDRLVRSDDLKRVLNTARSVKVPVDRRLLHVIPRGYAVDGQAGVKNPIGMHGFRLDVEAHIITAAITSVQNLVKCVRGPEKRFGFWSIQTEILSNRYKRCQRKRIFYFTIGRSNKLLNRILDKVEFNG